MASNGGNCVLTEAQAEVVLSKIRKGVSPQGAAQAVGRSLAWLQKVREQNAGFEEQFIIAVSEIEDAMTDSINDAATAGDAALVNALVAQRAKRFPTRHGNDPRFRMHFDVVGDSALEDHNTVKAQDSNAGVLGRLIDKYLEEDEKP